MLLSVLLAISAFLGTALIHLQALRWCSGRMAVIPMPPTVRAMTVIFVLLFVHLAEIAIYAAAYSFGINTLAIGGFSGESISGALDLFYFSAITFTSLGIGDIFPTGHIRFLTGVEALNGLLLLAWSASFLFALMNQLWEWQPCARPNA